MRPPVAKTVDHENEVHGHRWNDAYAWLKNKDDPEVIAYLEAENAYTEQAMAHTDALQRELYEEMVGRIQETDLSVPVRIDGYLYYSRTEEGRQYPIYCRKAAEDAAEGEADEEVLLDLNAEADGHDYLSLGVFEVSPDHRILAYALDTTGAESYTLRFKDLEGGARLKDEIEGVSYGLEWANDSRTVFYTIEDHAKRPYRLLRHELGQAVADQLLFEEPDQLFRVGIAKTKDHAFLVMSVASIETSEAWLLPADLSEPAFRLIESRDQGHRYRIEHRTGLLYILSNRDAPNFRLMTAPAAAPAEANWRELLGHDPGIMLNGLDMFESFLAIYERRSGLRSIRVLAFDDEASTTGNGRGNGASPPAAAAHEIAFEEPVFTVSGGRNPMYESRTLRFTYTSLTTPSSVYDYDMVTRERALLKRQPVLGDFDRHHYESERLFVTADDGAKIPVSLVYRKGLERDGTNPCLLYGYGAYGMSMDPGFSSHRLSLLDRGLVYAIAHIRGGQEMGRQWYDHGKFLAKKNSFADFIAAGRALIDGGYTRSDRLAIMGGSAGGLLVGAVANMAPDLMKAVVAKVPFVDVINTMLDETLPLTVPEYEEWGNPNDKTYFDYILSYSPYDNVEAKAYPAMLITAGLNDPRVHYWEPAKWAAKLRAAKTDHNPLLLKTNMGAGHGGASGRYDALKELAFDYAFILEMVQVGATSDAAGDSADDGDMTAT